MDGSWMDNLVVMKRSWYIGIVVERDVLQRHGTADPTLWIMKNCAMRLSPKGNASFCLRCIPAMYVLRT